MKKLFTFITIMSSLCLLVVPGIASAHVLKENNGISAVLHIPPEDNPEAAQQTKLNFEFSSDNGNFNIMNCNCMVHVKSNGKLIQTVSIVQSSSDTSSGEATITFPQIGVYDVLISGRSKNASFQVFALDYLERVETSAHSSNTGSSHISTAIVVSTASFILLVMTSYSIIKQGERYKIENSNK